MWVLAGVEQGTVCQCVCGCVSVCVGVAGWKLDLSSPRTVIINRILGTGEEMQGPKNH